MHGRCFPFILAGPEDMKTVLLDHQGRGSVGCKWYPYLRQDKTWRACSLSWWWGIHNGLLERGYGSDLQSCYFRPEIDNLQKVYIYLCGKNSFYIAKVSWFCIQANNRNHERLCSSRVFFLKYVLWYIASVRWPMWKALGHISLVSAASLSFHLGLHYIQSSEKIWS